jgi:ParB-like chromosome segregation protein Spo0J
MGKIVVRNSAQNLTVLEEIELRRVQDLAPHPESRRIPDMPPGEWKSFLEDVKKRGIVEPIEITDKNEILDGKHRWKAAKELGKAFLRHSAMGDEVA